MKNIYLDFDGTIIDSSARLYAVYKNIMTEFQRTYLSKDEYWDLKRERQPYAAILSKTGCEELAAECMKRFLQKIESPDFLKFDQLLDGARKTLTVLKKDNRLVLVTLRRSRENLFWELKDLKIFNLFDQIFDNFVEGANSWEVAAGSVRLDPEFNKENSIIVGDTEDTVLAARDLEIPSFVVLSGIRSKGFLEKFNPDYILTDINALPDCISQAGVKNC